MYNEENELQEKNSELNKCEMCENNEEQTILLRYPFTLSYKDITFSFLHEEKNSFICNDCFCNDVVERTYNEYGN